MTLCSRAEPSLSTKLGGDTAEPSRLYTGTASLLPPGKYFLSYSSFSILNVTFVFCPTCSNQYPNDATTSSLSWPVQPEQSKLFTKATRLSGVYVTRTWHLVRNCVSWWYSSRFYWIPHVRSCLECVTIELNRARNLVNTQICVT